MSVNMIKTCHKCSLLVLFYWISGFLKRHTNAQHFFPMDLFSHLAWIFHYFFSFYFRLKKRVALFSEIYVISIKCIITPQIGWTEFHENLWKMTSSLIWKFTLLNWSIVILWKMEIRRVYTKGNVCKDTKYHELQS